MGKIKDLEKSNWKILLFGPVGTGKTALALTLGKEAQVLDMDDGLITGKNLHDQFYEARLAVDVKQALENDVKKATSFVRAKAIITSIFNECKANTYPFKYFILDSYTALAEASVRSVMFMAGRPGEAPEIQHWGQAFLEIKNVMLLIRMLPITVVMIAHEQTREVDKLPMVEMATPGKNLPSEIPRYFDEVWRMRIRNLAGGKRAYTIQTLGTATVKVRSRSDLATDTDVGVGMPEILKRLVGKPSPVQDKEVKKA